MEATTQGRGIPDIGIDRDRTVRNGVLGASETGSHGGSQPVAVLEFCGGVEPEVGIVHGQEPAALRRLAGGEAGNTSAFQDRPGAYGETAAHRGIAQPGAAREHARARRIGVLAHKPGGKVDLGQVGIALEEVGKGAGGGDVHAPAVKGTIGGTVKELVAQEVVARKPALKILRSYLVQSHDGPYPTIPVVVPGARDVVVAHGPVYLRNRKVDIRNGAGPGKLGRSLGNHLVLGRLIGADGQGPGGRVVLPPGMVVLETAGKLASCPSVGDEPSGKVGSLNPVDRPRLGDGVAGRQVGGGTKPTVRVVRIPRPVLGLAGVVGAIDQGVAEARTLQDGILAQAELGQALATLKEGQVEGRGGRHVPVVQVEGGQAVVAGKGLGEVDHLAGVPGGHRGQCLEGGVTREGPLQAGEGGGDPLLGARDRLEGRTGVKQTLQTGDLRDIPIIKARNSRKLGATLKEIGQGGQIGGVQARPVKGGQVLVTAEPVHPLVGCGIGNLEGMGSISHDLGHQGGAVRHTCRLADNRDPRHTARVILALGDHLVAAGIRPDPEGARRLA